MTASSSGRFVIRFRSTISLSKEEENEEIE